MKPDFKNNILIIIITETGFEPDFTDAEHPFPENVQVFYDKWFADYTKHPFEAVFQLGFLTNDLNLSESMNYLRELSAYFIQSLIKTDDVELLREKTVVTVSEAELEELLENSPYLSGSEYLTISWLQTFFNNLNETFANLIKDFKGSVQELIQGYNGTLKTSGRVYFHLVESKREDFPFAFLATYSSIAEGKIKHLPLKNALTEYKNDQMKLLEILSTVNKTTEKSSFIKQLVDSGEIFYPIGLDVKDAYTFLKEVSLYEESGILCRIPNWWKNKSAAKINITMGNAPSQLNAEALIHFDIRLSLGGEPVNPEELRSIIASNEGLTLIKGKWVEVDRDKLNETLKAFEKAQKLIKQGDMSITEAMRFELNAKKLVASDSEPVELEVRHGDYLKSVMTKLQKPEILGGIHCGSDFHASLRNYQLTGLNWLYYMKSLGLGACLADDMGLGKTVQVIALLNYLKDRKGEKTLLVVPVSLIANWQDELKKFAPSIRPFVLHASQNKNFDYEEIYERHELFITTYSMTVKDDRLKTLKWDNIILDEAQAIKNAQTKQTRAVKELPGEFRIALTGTPVENRLGDLWSIFDFLNKGLLGTAKEFGAFIKNADYAKLKTVVSPFILRRLKTDKTIINDLPDKIEMKTYSVLSKKQAALYAQLVDELKRSILLTDGISRKGLILSSLMKFKQICNHPSEYLGDHDFDPADSGKFARLKEICETIYEKRERVLIFTQFREMTEPLKAFLDTVFHHEGLVLNGETPVKERKALVDRFQGNDYVPFMVLSIKAGGVGLNLTQANHVIHFDRWWNPAVENQATDRAFRIGQKKSVIVHKFITQGTMEEHIDEMIEEKVKLAHEIVPDINESFITEMSNEELLNLFKLNLS